MCEEKLSHLKIPVLCTHDTTRPTTTHKSSDPFTMPPLEGEIDRRSRRKLVKRNKSQRHTSMHFPERLKHGDDAQDDVASTDGKTAQYANQSIFSMIAAAGSKTNFHARFDDESSDSDPDQPAPKPTAGAGTQPVETSTISGSSNHDRTEERGKHDGSTEHRHRRIPLPKLHLRSPKERNYMSQSSHLPSSHRTSSLDVPKQITPRDAPVMSQMLAAQARSELTSSPRQSMEQEKANPPADLASSNSPGSLAARLMEIFGFQNPEDVLSGSSSFLRSWLDPFLTRV